MQPIEWFQRSMFCLVLLSGLTASSGEASAADNSSGTAQGTRWGGDYLPNLEVQDQDGKTFRFYDDLIKDKLVVINFIFTTCTDICPLTTARLALVQEKLGDVVGRDIFMYSITVDPEHDGPAELKRHAEAFHVGPGWRFLTGKPEDIAQIRAKLGERSKVLSEHRHEMLLGNAGTGQWERDSAFGDLDRVAFNIRSLDPKWRRQSHMPVSGEGHGSTFEVKNNPGEALFAKVCAACHTVGKGDRVGPDLNGVSVRRERGWLTNFIRAPDRMLAERDPIAVQLAAKYKGVQMPNLGISDQDAGDLVAYINARSYAADAENNPVSAASAAAHHDHHHHHKH